MDTLPCSGQTARWFSELSSELDIAAQICRTQCPLLEACAARAEKVRPTGGVWAGVRYHRGKPSPRARPGPKPRPGWLYDWTAEQTDEMVRLRASGLTWDQLSVRLHRSIENVRQQWLAAMSPDPHPVHIAVNNREFLHNVR